MSESHEFHGDNHLMKLLYLITPPSQQFCVCDTLFNVHDTIMKHVLRLTLYNHQGRHICITMFSSRKFLHFASVTLLFLFDNYRPIID